MDTRKNGWVSQNSLLNAVCSCNMAVLRALNWLLWKVIGWAFTLKSIFSIQHQHESSLQVAELLPGLPDDIPLTHIATKLPWTDVHNLSCVSLSWRRAIQSRQVYNERVRSKSRETLVAIRHINSKDMLVVSLYSMKQKALCKLPPIPVCVGGPRIFNFISRHFQLGSRNRFRTRLTSRSGKLYVVGVYGNDESMHMLDLAAGGKLWKLLYGGDPSSIYIGVLRILSELLSRLPDYYFLPAIEPPNFRIGDKNYIIRESGRRKRGRGRDILVFDVDRDSWVHLHGIVCDDLGARIKSIHVIMAVNNELLALADWQDRNGEISLCLIQSSGFGTDTKLIVWHKGPHSFHFELPRLVTMCSIQV